MGILTDLDNNLNADELYFGADSSLDVAPKPPRSVMPTPIVPPRSFTPLNDSEVSPPPKTRTPIITPPVVSIPRPIGDTQLDSGDDGMTTEPVSEEQLAEEGTGGSYGGGGGGGGGGMPPMEEEMPMEEARMDEACKIMNIDCKIFYGLLIALAVGGFYLYSRKNKVTK